MKLKIANRSGLRRIWAVITAVLTLILAVADPVSEMPKVMAAEELVLKLHYHRADDNYDGWDVWLWDAGKDGAGYAFAEEDGEMVATKVIEPGVTQEGFIVRTASWSKDIDKDQFIDLAEMVSGTVHIYVESGVEGYTKEYGDDAVTGIKLTSASYNEDSNTVIIKMTATVLDYESAFRLQSASGDEITAEAAEGNQYEYLLTPQEPLDLSGAYNVLYDDTEYKVVMPIIYSTEKFEAEYTYEGNDLGAVWTGEKTIFRVWAPTAESVAVNLYESGNQGTDDLIEQLPMQADVNGTWVAEKEGDLNGTYYTYVVEIGGQKSEACDPYARTTGVNGRRAMVIDLASTNPEGWDSDADPHAGMNYNDAVIYELHVRDLSTDASSGIENAGKFLGLTETGTTTPGGVATGLDHIKDLGITHLHLLPVYDYGSVDETQLDKAQFNWGYDPVNYNVPEGSYSTDPYNGEVRVREMKQMVRTLHDNNISVVMDVVYNHVYNAGEFCFNVIVPGYFSRVDENGIYSNGSGCGNDTASERNMVRKYIVDSVKYWADEYHIDGFRFDLVGLLDTETVNEIIEEVHKDHPSVIFYGEGWTMTTKLTKGGYTMATQVNSIETPGFAYFSDTIRDALKGSVFDHARGYVSGSSGKDTVISQCFTGLTSWCKSPAQTINYASCHDNLTLFDRLAVSATDASREDLIRMNNLAAAIYLTAEGIPFMQAGEEMLRTKPAADGSFDENSYASSDEVNSLKWGTLEEEEYWNVYEYYKGLIAFRKAHGALRLTNAEDVQANVSAVKDLPGNVLAFRINGGVNGETSDGLFIIFNPNTESQEVPLPEGVWDVYVNGEKAGTEVLDTISATATVAPISALVLVKGEGTVAETDKADTSTETNTQNPGTDDGAAQEPDSGFNTMAVVCAVIAVIAAVAVGVVLTIKKKSKK